MPQVNLPLVGIAPETPSATLLMAIGESNPGWILQGLQILRTRAAVLSLPAVDFLILHYRDTCSTGDFSQRFPIPAELDHSLEGGFWFGLFFGFFCFFFLG